MGATSKIEWTDATWNPVRARWKRMDFTPVSAQVLSRPVGWHCEHVSEGCRNCYAEAMNLRLGTRLDFKPGNLAPRGAVEVFLDETMLLAPLRWTKPRMIFAGSMTDLFADFVTDAMLDRIFAVMALRSRHTYQLLTKRPERMRAYLTEGATRERIGVVQRAIDRGTTCHEDVGDGGTWPLPNVWLGTSVEDQAAADARIPALRATPAARRFLSIEPLLGPLDLDPAWYQPCPNSLDGLNMDPSTGQYECCSRCDWTGIGDVIWLDWVIVGGESGLGARPMHPDWARALRDQCAAVGVPFFFKQWGWCPPGNMDGEDENGGPAWQLDEAVTGTEGDYLSPEQEKSAGLATARATSFMFSGEEFLRFKRPIKLRLLDGVTHDGMPS